MEFFATFPFRPGAFMSIGTAKTRRDKIPSALICLHCGKATAPTNHARASSLGMKQNDICSGEARNVGRWAIRMHHGYGKRQREEAKRLLSPL